MAKDMFEDVKYVMIDSHNIEMCVYEMARDLDEEFEGKHPLLVCVLKGSVMFFADLLKEIETNVELGFISASSYGNTTTSSGEVKLGDISKLQTEGRDVYIVEDIVDSGHTLVKIKEEFKKQKNCDVKVITLLDKPSRREVEVTPDFVGFTIPDEFVAGYGLDFNEYYRNLPCVCVMKEECYL